MSKTRVKISRAERARLEEMADQLALESRRVYADLLFRICERYDGAEAYRREREAGTLAGLIEHCAEVEEERGVMSAALDRAQEAEPVSYVLPEPERYRDDA